MACYKRQYNQWKRQQHFYDSSICHNEQYHIYSRQTDTLINPLALEFDI